MEHQPILVDPTAHEPFHDQLNNCKRIDGCSHIDNGFIEPFTDFIEPGLF